MDAVSKRNPVRIAMSTLAALQALVAGSAFLDIVGAKVAALLALMVVAAQLGISEYVRGQVTPWADVVAKRTDDGAVVAGPSAEAPTGVEVQEPAPVDGGYLSAGYLTGLALAAAGVVLAVTTSLALGGVIAVLGVVVLFLNIEY